jgi:hypothetical protein
MEYVDNRNIGELQKAADYYAFLKSVKGKAVPNIIWGVINIIWGLIAMFGMSTVNIVLVLIGVFLLAVGVWSLVTQTLNILLFEGISLCILAGWNIVISILNFATTIASGGSYIGPIGIMWAVWQIAWGIDAFTRYRRFSSIQLERPSKEMLQTIERISKPVMKANFKKEPDIIQFNRQSAWTPSVWKGKLNVRGVYSIITSKNGDDVFLVYPQDIEITQSGKFRKLLKASLKVRGLSFQGTIDPMSFQRYEAWKKAV